MGLSMIELINYGRCWALCRKNRRSGLQVETGVSTLHMSENTLSRLHDPPIELPKKKNAHAPQIAKIAAPLKTTRTVP